MKKLISVLLSTILVAWVLTIPAAHCETVNPYLQPDRTWISISGTAVSPKADAFTLDYGRGTILVEMDDWDFYKEGWKIMDGDQVTVYGEIDDGLYERRSIEAGSVYVGNLGTYFYASSSDEENRDQYDYWITGDPVDIGVANLRGQVTGISGREFTIAAGTRELKVDTSMMPYNPLDDKGYQQIEKGDYVSVSGSIHNNFWERREIRADSVTTLKEDIAGK